jgi:hypothetical protein
MRKSLRQKQSITKSKSFRLVEIQKQVVDYITTTQKKCGDGHIINGNLRQQEIRIGRYRKDYRGKIQRQLEFMFESVFAILNVRDRELLLNEFVNKRRSVSYSLVDIGPDFLAYLSEHDLAKKKCFLLDLALFEWNIILALVAVPEDENSSILTFSTKWPVYRIWKGENKNLKSKTISTLSKKQYFNFKKDTEGVAVKKINKITFSKLQSMQRGNSAKS